MAATFTTATGNWEGSLKGSYQTADKVAGLADPQDGYLWRRKIYTIERSRYGQTLSSFTPNVGGSALGNTLSVKSGPTTITGSATDTYMLLRDDVTPAPKGSDIWLEEQTAVSYTAWEEWEIPT